MRSVADRFPLVPGHDAFHEFVEEGDSKRCVAVSRAPDHTFGYESGADRAQRLYRPFEFFGDVSGAMRTAPQIGHRTQVLLLHGGEAIETDPEKSLVKRRNG